MKLEDNTWKEFFIGGENGIFDITSSSSGIDKNKLLSNTKKANIPYITRSEENNGINLFIQEKQSDKYNLDEKNVITIGLDTQTVFYQSHKFYTGQNIQILKHKKLNKLNAEFLIPLIKVQMQKFNWGGNGATLGRLYKTKIMLPVNQKDTIDWEFMEEYTKSIIDKKLNNYKKYVQTILEKLQYKEIDNLQEKEWREFVIEDLFDIQIGKSIDGNKIDKFSGKVPYITRKETSNGYDGFISYDKKYLYENAPVITIGNETAMPFVQIAKNFFTGTKVNIMKSKNDVSENVLFFVSQSIKQQKNKYSYSITINSTRLKRQRILLPINSKDEPDYAYMEQYIINMKHKKIKQYLDYLEKQKKDS